jgi:hypothetical protein
MYINWSVIRLLLVNTLPFFFLQVKNKLNGRTFLKFILGAGVVTWPQTEPTVASPSFSIQLYIAFPSYSIQSFVISSQSTLSSSFFPKIFSNFKLFLQPLPLPFLFNLFFLLLTRSMFFTPPLLLSIDLLLILLVHQSHLPASVPFNIRKVLLLTLNLFVFLLSCWYRSHLFSAIVRRRKPHMRIRMNQLIPLVNCSLSLL